jgi:putative oxidoreductase
MKKFLFDCGTHDPIASSGLVVLRVGIGLMMLIGHGIGKITDYQKLAENWPVPDFWPLSYMSKPISLMATIGAEVGAAGLLVLGLMTRPAAFVLGFAMCVAAFQVHANDPFFSKGGASKEFAVLYLIPCFVLILSGAGQWSLDATFSLDKRRRRR